MKILVVAIWNRGHPAEELTCAGITLRHGWNNDLLMDGAFGEGICQFFRKNGITIADAQAMFPDFFAVSHMNGKKNALRAGSNELEGWSSLRLKRATLPKNMDALLPLADRFKMPVLVYSCIEGTTPSFLGKMDPTPVAAIGNSP